MAADKPNILIIWGDDIGWFNVGAYNMGMMGYKTPNIDRIAKEGALFTDWYGQQSCTAGRAAFITDQAPIRLQCSTWTSEVSPPLLSSSSTASPTRLSVALPPSGSPSLLPFAQPLLVWPPRCRSRVPSCPPL